MRIILTELRTIFNSSVLLPLDYGGRMLVVTRFRVPVGDGDAFRADALVAHDALASRPGYVSGSLGRNLDDAELWVLVTHWESVGAYRRALSAYDVKLHAVPLLSRAIDEPSAFEPADDGTDLNVAKARSLG
jgi:quinol monooxygenase YgiN